MWGQRWGQLTWGSATAVPSLPAFYLVALGVLLGALGAVALGRRGLRSKIPWVIGAAVLCVPLVAMSDVVLPFRFTNGAVADANQVNNDLDTLTAAVNAQASKVGRLYVGVVTVPMS